MSLVLYICIYFLVLSQSHSPPLTGQSQGLINDVPTVDDLIQRIVQEAKDIHTNIGRVNFVEEDKKEEGEEGKK